MTLRTALFAGALLIAAPAASLASTETRADGTEIAFEVFRNGDEFGQHRIAFSRKDDSLVVTVDIALKVKFAFFTVWSYDHQARSEWRDGRLYRLETKTDSNGKKRQVTGEATAEGFAVTDAEGRQTVLSADIVPTTYWHPQTRNQSQLLNTQTGNVLAVTIRPAETLDEIQTPWGSKVEARRHKIDAAIDWSVWYDGAGCLMSLFFVAEKDGSKIDYKLRRHLNPETAAWLKDEPLLTAYVNSPSLQRGRDVAQAASDDGAGETNTP